ncbi:cytochrome P450 [Aspergillus heteromorphus CBS 117.55]|uniref:Cytochrome P450 n=1 Tax=Aspergillus heteromorphus CBS 117.55 TaxID=1448321 RepID=A0A317VAA4_9EURO|nr:cytochrome P450 [Aspergillus heteromorphus CBS 117.55]PWY71015.1 cytochrome P450 [Aspergillus heteromorphus CBS 117.55]
MVLTSLAVLWPGLTDQSSYLLLAALIATTATFLLHFLDPLSSIPGPFWARWSPLWMINHSLNGDMHRTMIHLHDKHGALVRTGPKEVSTSDPSAIQEIYGSCVGSKFMKSDWYSVWQGRRKFDLFPERDAKVHGSQRRFVNSIYSMSGLRELEPYLDDVLRVLLDRLGEVDGKRIDMSYWAQLFAFDVIGELTFSKRFGFLDTANDKGTFAQIESALQSAAWIGQVPWLYWVHDWLAPWIGNHLGITNRNGILRQIAAKEVEQRKTRDGAHRDILEKLMKVHRKTPEQFDGTAVLSMASSNIFAGSDTTAISIGAILYYLCKYPDFKARLVDEILAEAKEGSIERGLVPWEVARKMPYLQACIHEGLRCHPAVGMSMPRVVPAEGITVDGKYLPGGTVIGANPWVVHRNKQVFGDDADTFRPDRWLEDDANVKERFFLAFGAGSRTCLGKSLSLIEISKLLPCLLLENDMEFADPSADIVESCWWFVKIQGLFLRLTRREGFS